MRKLIGLLVLIAVVAAPALAQYTPMTREASSTIAGVKTYSAQPVFNAGIDVNEDIDIDLNASDEEIDIAASQTAGTADTPLIKVDDDRTGATADAVAESTLWIDAEGTYAVGILDGAVAVESVIDTYAAGALSLAPATANAITLGASDITTTVAGTLALNGPINRDVVVVTDTNAYTVLANNSGQVHLVPDLTADSTITMPTEAANLYYQFVYVGGAADAQDWLIDTGADANYFVGGLNQIDADATNSAPWYNSIDRYSDGDSNSKLGVLTPEAGTTVHLYCEDGTTWYLWGTVYSDTEAGVTFADQ